MSTQSSQSETAPILTEKTPTVDYRKRYDQVSWRSADTDFETDPTSAANGGTNAKKGWCSFFCTKRSRKIWALIVVVIIFLIIMISLIYLYYSKPSQMTPTEQVQTDCGLVEGVVIETKHSDMTYPINVFKGIPYAVPPTGKLRWKPPQPLAPGRCWKNVLKAHRFGTMCAQGKDQGSEDCLYLNVITPKLKVEEPLPVFVWLHGGYLMEGSGNASPHTPNIELSLQLNAVVVTLNYRLNIFGFLTLAELWEDGVSYGNYGLMDQIQALHWIQTNIRNFGGNPDSVTLCGHNAGGSSVLALLMSPLATGLFHKAISMSGLPEITRSYKDVAQQNREFINGTECRNATSVTLKDCLYQLSTQQLSAAVPYFPNSMHPFIRKDFLDFPSKAFPDEVFNQLIVVDPIVVKQSPNIPDQTSVNSKPVSVLIGSMAQEIGISPVFTFKEKKTYSKYLKQRLGQFSSNFSEIVLTHLYNNTGNSLAENLQAEYLHETIASDVRAVCPTNSLAAVLSASPKFRVFRYVVTHTPHTPITLFNHAAQFAFHMWDKVALFGYSAVREQYTPSASDVTFRHNLHGNFKHFVNFGHMLDSDWSQGVTGVFGENGTLSILSGTYHAKQCGFWNDPKNGFRSYAWSD